MVRMRSLVSTGYGHHETDPGRVFLRSKKFAQQKYTQHMTDLGAYLPKYGMAETIKIVKQTPQFAKAALLIGSFGWAVASGLQYQIGNRIRSGQSPRAKRSTQTSMSVTLPTGRT